MLPTNLASSWLGAASFIIGSVTQATTNGIPDESAVDPVISDEEQLQVVLFRKSDVQCVATADHNDIGDTTLPRLDAEDNSEPVVSPYDAASGQSLFGSVPSNPNVPSRPIFRGSAGNAAMRSFSEIPRQVSDAHALSVRETRVLRWSEPATPNLIERRQRRIQAHRPYQYAAPPFSPRSANVDQHAASSPVRPVALITGPSRPRQAPSRGGAFYGASNPDVFMDPEWVDDPTVVTTGSTGRDLEKWLRRKRELTKNRDDADFDPLRAAVEDHAKGEYNV